MDVAKLIGSYPRLYHMAETGTWDSIRKHGLLSTTALLDLFEVKGEERRRIESERRPQSVIIRHPKYGQAVIRDQKPMTESALLKCLEKPVKPRDWYLRLNGNVFFWLSSKRLSKLLSARAYRNQQHCVLTLDTAGLIYNHGKNVTLSPLNSGSTIYTPQPRGNATFQKIADFPFEERRASRPLENAVVELLIKYSVPDVAKYVLKVEERKGDSVVKTLYTRD